MIKNVNAFIYIILLIVGVVIVLETYEEACKIADFSKSRFYMYCGILGFISSMLQSHYMNNGITTNGNHWGKIIVRSLIFGGFIALVFSYIHYVEYESYANVGMGLLATLTVPFEPSKGFRILLNNDKDGSIKIVEHDKVIYEPTNYLGLVTKFDPGAYSHLNLLFEKYHTMWSFHPWIYWMYNIEVEAEGGPPIPANLFANAYCSQCFKLQMDDDGTHFGFRHKPNWITTPLMIRYWNWFHDYLEKHATDKSLHGMYLSTLTGALVEFSKSGLLPSGVSVKLVKIHEVLKETLRTEQYHQVEKEGMDYFFNERDLLPFLIRYCWELGQDKRFAPIF